jgi:hypothetical protein
MTISLATRWNVAVFSDQSVFSLDVTPRTVGRVWVSTVVGVIDQEFYNHNHVWNDESSTR